MCNYFNRAHSFSVKHYCKCLEQPSLFRKCFVFDLRKPKYVSNPSLNKSPLCLIRRLQMNVWVDLEGAGSIWLRLQSTDNHSSRVVWDDKKQYQDVCSFIIFTWAIYLIKGYFWLIYKITHFVDSSLLK